MANGDLSPIIEGREEEIKSAGLRFLKRVVTSTALIAASAYVLFFMPPIYFSAEVILFIALALFEFLT